MGTAAFFVVVGFFIAANVGAAMTFVLLADLASWLRLDNPLVTIVVALLVGLSGVDIMRWLMVIAPRLRSKLGRGRG